MLKIKKSFHFHAAHRNTSAGEKCGRLHGHTYHITAFFSFLPPSKQGSGVTMLFSDIEARVEPIIKALDHYLLLHDADPLCELLRLAAEPFQCLPFETSAEHLAMWLFSQIKTIGHLPITRLELAETTTSTVVYEPA
jgi:6-pyruvoyltetrahydropterin/6-carboxytetrahydropterin synthase